MDVFAGGGEGGGSGGSAGNLLVAWGQALETLWSDIFGDIFGGGSTTPPNYAVFEERLHAGGRHPLYAGIIGIKTDLVPDQREAAPAFCADPHPCNTPPLGRSVVKPDAGPAPSSATLRVACKAQIALALVGCGIHYGEVGAGLGAGISGCLTAGELPAGPISTGTCLGIVGAVLGPPTAVAEGLLIRQCAEEIRSLEQSCGK